jgi:hypothetical protein
MQTYRHEYANAHIHACALIMHMGTHTHTHTRSGLAARRPHFLQLDPPLSGPVVFHLREETATSAWMVPAMYACMCVCVYECRT